MMPPVPPWAVGNTPEPVSLDIDGFVDVSAYVRFEETLPDIQYGVLDIQVNFHHQDNLMNVYFLHFFALAENYPRCAAAVPGWQDGFNFPPALTKMRVQYQERWINVCTQQCVAINDRGISVYGSNKGYRWRLVHHILYHEQPLLALMESKVDAFSRSPIGSPPVTWSWMRPPGVAPRQMARRRVAPDPYEGADEAGQRFTAREHYRVDTALYNRVQAMLVSLRDVEHLLPMMPLPVQQRMVLPLTTVHADLNGLLFSAYLLASAHPNSDDFDV